MSARFSIDYLIGKNEKDTKMESSRFRRKRSKRQLSIFNALGEFNFTLNFCSNAYFQTQN